jgi:predicted Zn finger-like uncharacterized protein
MIIACPSCSARYIVDPAKIGPDGRTVKCAKCAHAWAQPAPTPEEMAEAIAPAQTPEPSAPETAAPQPSEEELANTLRERIGREPAAPDYSDEDDDIGDNFRANFDDAFSQDAQSGPRPLRSGSSSNLPAIAKEPSRWPARLAWIGLIVAIIGVFGSAILFQDTVVKSWPASKWLYDMIGSTDAKIEEKLGVRSVQYTYPTSTTLKIDGELVNLSKAPQNVPNLRVLFLDAGGKVVKRWTFPPRERRLLPDEVIKFSTIVQNPPADAKRIDVGLDNN